LLRKTITTKSQEQSLNDALATPALAAGYALRKPRHDRHVVFCGWLSLPIELGPCSGKAVKARGQYDPGLGGLGPNMACDLNGVGVVVAATRDGANFWPALKGQANGRTAGWAKVNKDLFLATL
jgi:hypothetical protein